MSLHNAAVHRQALRVAVPPSQHDVMSNVVLVDSTFPFSYSTALPLVPRPTHDGRCIRIVVARYLPDPERAF